MEWLNEFHSTPIVANVEYPRLLSIKGAFKGVKEDHS